MTMRNQESDEAREANQVVKKASPEQLRRLIQDILRTAPLNVNPRPGVHYDA
ncbi:MAG: hypothetical protein P8N72_12320 [Flavimaricola sp.]|nr:hypothetical protein [Flavimaricola sp.]